MNCLLIFDFDGVILESVEVKTDAFRSLFSFSPEHVDQIIKFHIDNGGMSRFEKFRYIYRNILHEELSQDRFETLSARFSEIVEEKVIQAPFVTGVPKLLEKFYPDYPMYIVSATPQEELIRIINARGIFRYFREILGSPETKTAQIQRIIKTNNLPSNKIIFIGDAINDWKAARDCGVKFIARLKQGEPDRFSQLQDVEYTITDMHDLIKYLDEKKC
ncbi:MAG: HAD-IA family hydrolase [Methanoregulaceae archaeon]|jgi:HAD superfamily hydrolase (TIGR01549 family)